MGLPVKTAKAIEQVYGRAVRQVCFVEQSHVGDIEELEPLFVQIIAYIAISMLDVLRLYAVPDDESITEKEAEEAAEEVNNIEARINSWHRRFAEHYWRFGLYVPRSPYYVSTKPFESAELVEPAKLAELAETAEPSELAKPSNP